MMDSPIFDTQQFVKQLVEAGLSQDQAEAHLKAVQDALTPLASKSLNKLDSTDYENIYLQVRNRGWKWFAGVAAFFGGATILGAAGTVYVSASRSVDKYMRTEAFQKQIVSTVLSRVSNIDDRLRMAEQASGLSKSRLALSAICRWLLPDDGGTLIRPNLPRVRNPLPGYFGNGGLTTISTITRLRLFSIFWSFS